MALAPFAPINAQPVLNSPKKPRPIAAIPVYIINDASVAVAPVNAIPVKDVTGNPAYPVAPLWPIPIVYGTSAPEAPIDAVPIAVIGTVP